MEVPFERWNHEHQRSGLCVPKGQRRRRVVIQWLLENEKKRNKRECVSLEDLNKERTLCVL